MGKTTIYENVTLRHREGSIALSSSGLVFRETGSNSKKDGSYEIGWESIQRVKLNKRAAATAMIKVTGVTDNGEVENITFHLPNREISKTLRADMEARKTKQQEKKSQNEHAKEKQKKEPAQPATKEQPARASTIAAVPKTVSEETSAVAGLVPTTRKSLAPPKVANGTVESSSSESSGSKVDYHSSRSTGISLPPQQNEATTSANHSFGLDQPVRLVKQATKGRDRPAASKAGTAVSSPQRNTSAAVNTSLKRAGRGVGAAGAKIVQCNDDDDDDEEWHEVYPKRQSKTPQKCKVRFVEDPVRFVDDLDQPSRAKSLPPMFDPVTARPDMPRPGGKPRHDDRLQRYVALPSLGIRRSVNDQLNMSRFQTRAVVPVLESTRSNLNGSIYGTSKYFSPSQGPLLIAEAEFEDFAPSWCICCQCLVNDKIRKRTYARIYEHLVETNTPTAPCCCCSDERCMEDTTLVYNFDRPPNRVGMLWYCVPCICCGPPYIRFETKVLLRFD